MATKLLPAGELRQSQDYKHSRYFCTIPEGHSFDDLFVPTYWGNARHLKPNDLVRARHIAGAFDVQLNVVTTVQGGITMELWPKFPDAAALSAPVETNAKREVNGKPVPRVDHTKNTKWRVIGLDGNEHSRGYNTKGEAEIAMRAYAKAVGIEVEVETLDAA